MDAASTAVTCPPAAPMTFEWGKWGTLRVIYWFGFFFNFLKKIFPQLCWSEELRVGSLSIEVKEAESITCGSGPNRSKLWSWIIQGKSLLGLSLSQPLRNNRKRRNWFKVSSPPPTHPPPPPHPSPAHFWTSTKSEIIDDVRQLLNGARQVVKMLVDRIFVNYCDESRDIPVTFITRYLN